MEFSRGVEEIEAALGIAPDLAVVDLTTAGWDYDALFAGLEARVPRVPVLGFTTHVLARQTQPMHARCDRVVTKETLTRELPRILTEGIAWRESSGAAAPPS